LVVRSIRRGFVETSSRLSGGRPCVRTAEAPPGERAPAGPITGVPDISHAWRSRPEPWFKRVKNDNQGFFQRRQDRPTRLPRRHRFRKRPRSRCCLVAAPTVKRWRIVLGHDGPRYSARLAPGRCQFPRVSSAPAVRGAVASPFQRHKGARSACRPWRGGRFPFPRGFFSWSLRAAPRGR
jgi:hypothetical protein